MPAVNPDIRACHKAASIANQEYSGTSVLLRLTQFPQHILRRPFYPSLRKSLKELFNHGGDDIAGRDSVDADTVQSPFRRKIPCELKDAGF